MSLAPGLLLYRQPAKVLLGGSGAMASPKASLGCVRPVPPPASTAAEPNSSAPPRQPLRLVVKPPGPVWVAMSDSERAELEQRARHVAGILAEERLRRPAAGRVHELPGGGVAEGGPAEGGDVDMREVPAAENVHELPGDGVTKEEPADVDMGRCQLPRLYTSCQLTSCRTRLCVPSASSGRSAAPRASRLLHQRRIRDPWQAVHSSTLSSCAWLTCSFLRTRGDSSATS